MKRIGRFFLRLGLRARLMLVIGILAFVLTAGSIAAFSYAIEFTEDHLVSENQYYSLRGYIDSDIAHGKAPRLLPNKKALRRSERRQWRKTGTHSARISESP